MSKKNNQNKVNEMEDSKSREKDVAAQEENKQAREEELKTSRTKGKKKKPTTREELDELKIQYQELNDKFLRLFADFDNYRKNCNKDKIELIKTASQKVNEGLLPVMDDFDRALDAMKTHLTDEEAINGVELIYNKLFTFLKQQGLQPMDSQGKEFDTDYHDAITQIPAPTEDLKGKVVDVIQKGYLLNDKIIRHAKVVVGQ